LSAERQLESVHIKPGFHGILLWIFVPGFTAAGAALLICFMMRCRMDEAIAHERGALAELQSALVVQRQTLESAISDAKAEASARHSTNSSMISGWNNASTCGRAGCSS
jgi:hypothetical protein